MIATLSQVPIQSIGTKDSVALTHRIVQAMFNLSYHTNAFIVNLSKKLSFGKGLTLYYTMSTFNDLLDEAFRKRFEKRRKCC